MTILENLLVISSLQETKVGLYMPSSAFSFWGQDECQAKGLCASLCGRVDREYVASSIRLSLFSTAG